VPTFADIGVPDDLCAVLASRHIVEPFPIQALTVPDALAGRDICGRAPTGSGKTLAFGLAVAARASRRAQPRRPRALVLVPTRELAAQVATEIQTLLPRSTKVATIYGGASYGPQRRALAKGAAVVVACPGRLEDLLEQGALQLDEVDVVVLDEADRMADMGFMPAVRRILDQTKSNRQTLLFSATLDGDVDALVRRYQRDPARHEADADEESVGDVDHLFWRVTSSAHRIDLVAQLVRQHGRAVVFCRTRRGADRLATHLKTNGVASAAIHGNRSQAQRERALAAFAKGRVTALVATDVAARGIHVDDVGCVVHFDLPADAKDYIHRSGRTGRAGATGTVVTLVTHEQRRALKTLQRSLGLPQESDTPAAATAVAAPTGDLQKPAEAEPDQRAGSVGPHRKNGRRPDSGKPRSRPARPPRPRKPRRSGGGTTAGAEGRRRNNGSSSRSAGARSSGARTGGARSSGARRRGRAPAA
jgi:superfamily II DNA/RNA helicase